MKVEELERLEALAVETKRLRNALRRYESALTSQTSNFACDEEKRDTGDCGAITAHRALEAARRVLEMEREMVEIIDGVPKPRVRKIMRWRYIRGRSWGQVAHELGYADSAAPYRVLLRFRKNMSKTRENDNGLGRRRAVKYT